MDPNIVQETIDSRIIKLLGLVDGDVLSYDQYYRDLREIIAKNSFGSKKLSQEFLAILVNEKKRIFKNPGIFRVGEKKIKFSQKKSPTKKSALNFIRPQKTENLSSTKKEKKSETPESLLHIVVAIRKTVDSIHKTIEDQTKFIQSISETNRRKEENERRKNKEEKLESKKNPALELAEKIVAPFQSIFDKIIRFLVFTILGRAFKVFMDWAGDPKNKDKLATIGKFLKDWWPALLSAWFLFATPLGGFIRAIIGTVAKLSFQLAKFAIPKLVKFVAANPKAAAAAAVIGGGAYLATQITGQQKAAPVQAQNKAKVQTGKTTEVRGTDTGIDKSPSVGDMGPTTPFGLLQGVNTGGIIKPLIQGASEGGSIFSGIVDKDTGETVSGAGSDTQYLPIEGGGGAVLQRGESVLQVGARERMIRQAGVDPLAYNIGSNANKPRKINADTLASSGGLIGLNKGGQIGGSTPVGNNPNFWITAAIAGKEAGHIPQGQADVAQSIYNRSKVGIYPGGKDIKKIITAPGQYQPTFGNPGAWSAIKDKNSATKAVGDSKLLDMSVKSITNPSLQRNAAKYIGSRTDFQGESQKPHMKPEKGDITRGKNHNFFGWFTENGYKQKLSSPAPPLVTSPTPSQKPIDKPQKQQSTNIFGTVGNIFNKLIGKQDGGIIKGTDGTKNPHSSTDTRAFPIVNSNKRAALQVGEGVVPRDVMQNIGGEDGFNRFITMFDSGRDSKAAKLGYIKPKVNIPQPPSIKGRNGNITTLPPISQSAGSQVLGKGASVGSNVPSFSTISSTSISIRQNNADIYGIVG